MAWSAGAGAEDWPQFRGPGGQGHSTEKNLPFEWGEGRNVAWRTPVPGRGWSSPVVAGGRVWLTTAVDNSGGVSMHVLAFDAATGEAVVRVEAFLVGGLYLRNTKNSHASPTPAQCRSRTGRPMGPDCGPPADWKELAQASFRAQREPPDFGGKVATASMLPGQSKACARSPCTRQQPSGFGFHSAV
jgi:hypothetical protein